MLLWALVPRDASLTWHRCQAADAFLGLFALCFGASYYPNYTTKIGVFCLGSDLKEN